MQKWLIPFGMCRFLRVYGALTGKTVYFCVTQISINYATRKKQRIIITQG
ncbi:hypothetical protein BSCG_05771 [Bacteroides sp. 2_2_4]|nr:hypothetical protein BSCG_05771 [Bacteroides sp. 2_2_4]